MKILTSILITAICALALMTSVAAAINSMPSNMTVILKYGEEPLSGINIAVCRVADAREISGKIAYDAATSFSGAAADFTNLTIEKNIALAANLNAYASVNNIERSAKFTDSYGKAAFIGLSAGLYLVAQLNGETSDYIIEPYLVAVPQPNEGSGEARWNYNVVAYPKTEPVKRISDDISVSVHKIWAGTNNPPSSILVQLYQNGKPYGEAVTLNSGNYWSKKWEHLNPADIWTVDELSIPDYYTKTVSGNADSGFIITNTKIPSTPSNPGDGPKTEDAANMQLWIMLIITGSAGLFTVIYILNSKRLSRALRFSNVPKS